MCSPLFLISLQTVAVHIRPPSTGRADFISGWDAGCQTHACSGSSRVAGDLPGGMQGGQLFAEVKEALFPFGSELPISALAHRGQ